MAKISNVREFKNEIIRKLCAADNSLIDTNGNRVLLGIGGDKGTTKLEFISKCLRQFDEFITLTSAEQIDWLFLIINSRYYDKYFPEKHISRRRIHKDSCQYLLHSVAQQSSVVVPCVGICRLAEFLTSIKT